VAKSFTQNRLHLQERLEVVVRGDDIALPSREATALTLAVNELVQNALKHAFAGRESGRIAVILEALPTGFRVVVEDDGVGLMAEAMTPEGLGLQIIETLVTQDLGGELTFEPTDGGTCAAIVVRDKD
jgi:two-component sensor histidine kinase